MGSHQFYRLKVLKEYLAICKLPAGSPIPPWAEGQGFSSITRTRSELSVVCGSNRVPGGVQAEAGWRGLEVDGPLDFELVGVLAALSTSLANAGVGIFVISTYDTDYLLVREVDLPAAVHALEAAGHSILDEGSTG